MGHIRQVPTIQLRMNSVCFPTFPSQRNMQSKNLPMPTIINRKNDIFKKFREKHRSLNYQSKQCDIKSKSLTITIDLICLIPAKMGPI